MWIFLALLSGQADYLSTGTTVSSSVAALQSNLVIYHSFDFYYCKVRTNKKPRFAGLS